MEITMLKGKIHRATVVEAKLDYVGSITVDEDLLDASGIYEYEKVQIVDINNGSRFETYTIAGERGSGLICLNGAAARCVSTGDKIIIMAYAQMRPEEVKQYPPKVVFVDDHNKIHRVTRYEKHGSLVDMERYASGNQSVGNPQENRVQNQFPTGNVSQNQFPTGNSVQNLSGTTVNTSGNQFGTVVPTPFGTENHTGNSFGTTSNTGNSTHNQFGNTGNTGNPTGNHLVNQGNASNSGVLSVQNQLENQRNTNSGVPNHVAQSQFGHTGISTSTAQNQFPNARNNSISSNVEQNQYGNTGISNNTVQNQFGNSETSAMVDQIMNQNTDQMVHGILQQNTYGTTVVTQASENTMSKPKEKTPYEQYLAQQEAKKREKQGNGTPYDQYLAQQDHGNQGTTQGTSNSTAGQETRVFSRNGFGTQFESLNQVFQGEDAGGNAPQGQGNPEEKPKGKKNKDAGYDAISKIFDGF